MIQMAQKDGGTDFRLVWDAEQDESVRYSILRIRDAFLAKYNAELGVCGGTEGESAHEIIVGSRTRPECAALTASLAEGEYAIRVLSDGGRVKVVLAYNGSFARMGVIDRFLREFAAEEGCSVPADLELRGVCREEDVLVTSDIPQLRDPCVLVGDDGTYYAYGTGWKYYENASGSLAGPWKGPFSCVEVPEEVDGCQWAPEVHRYAGAYYMITTYHSSKTGHRGCTILRSDTPKGPFREISAGQITPHDWDSIDGTLYVAPDGQPWLVFVHEWTSTPDKVGRMAAAKLSDDLTALISEPIELFGARDARWATNGVTDGCWMYTTESGELLMLWSNWDNRGYCVGIARSDNGRLDGHWKHDDARLYSKGQTGTYDGGHAMIFTDTDGQKYLSFHSPNNASDGRRETPVFLPIREENGTLIWNVCR